MMIPASQNKMIWCRAVVIIVPMVVVVVVQGGGNSGDENSLPRYPLSLGNFLIILILLADKSIRQSPRWE
jgi:hypothetical protein